MELPAPLTPTDCDLRDFDGFMMNVERILASELWALSTPEEFKAAFALWCRAWKQVPCASLPDDDAILAAYSGTGKRWPKVKKMALRGFVKCFDGRLYHSTLAADALRAMAKKAERRERTQAATKARLEKQRNEQRNEPRHERRNEPRDVIEKPNVTTSQGQGQGQGQKKSSSQVLSTAPPAAELPLERLCRLMKIDAATLHRRPSFQAFPAVFYDWKLKGCEPETDIWPVIERLGNRSAEIKSPAYFEPAVMRARDDRIAALPSEKERWRTRIAGFKAEGFWPDQPPPTGYGPRPGQPGCLCPPELLIEVAA